MPEGAEHVKPLIAQCGFSQAALGAEVEVPTLKGMVQLTIPAGTQSGKKMRIKGKGIANLGGYGIGDQIITIHVETPTKLTSEERELFKQLSEVEKKSSRKYSSSGLFDKVRDLFSN